MKRRLLALAVLLGGLSHITFAPAYGGHTDYYGHWGNGFSPSVWSNNIPDDVVQDGAYFWQDRNFVQGYRPPLPNHGAACGTSGDQSTAGDGSIDICIVSRASDPYLSQGFGGITYFRHGCDNACNHIYAVTIRVADDLSIADRQKIVRHEFGHALGLGHNATDDSVMHTPVYTPFSNEHDLDAMYAMYVSHGH